MSDLKTEPEKKQKVDEPLLSMKSKMASNKENEDKCISNSELDSELDINMDSEGEQSFHSFMQNISRDINKSINGLSKRMTKMETSFEQTLVNRLCSVINDTVKEEMARVRSEFDSELCAVRTKLVDLENAVCNRAPDSHSDSSQRNPCSVVIRNLKPGHNETEGSNSIGKNKVISLVRD